MLYDGNDLNVAVQLVTVYCCLPDKEKAFSLDSCESTVAFSPHWIENWEKH